MDDSFDHCRTLVREADRDRYLATLFAPEKNRRPLFALYAFNVEVARVRELAREPFAGAIRLQWWSEAITGAGRGVIEAQPVASALLDTIARGLPTQPLLDLIEAREFDLYDDPMPTVSDLERYATRTSSALIDLAARILGAQPDPDLAKLINQAGIAYAITGLLRAFPLHTV